MRPLALFALAMAGLAGCAAQVSVTVDDTVVGTANRAVVATQANNAVVQSVQLQVGGRSYTVTPAPIDLGLRMPGEYTAQATVWFKRLFSGQLESATAQALFRVREAEGCFSFDDPQVPGLSYTGSTQSWSNGGYKRVLNDAEADVPNSRSPGMVWDDAADSAHASPADRLGGLHLSSSRNDQPPGADPSYAWYFDLRSPGLAAYPQWQGINGLRFSVRGFAAANADLKIQAILRVRRPDGVEVLAAQGTEANRVFYPVTTEWTAHDSRIPLPAGTVVLGAVLRLHGVAAAPRENLRVYVDAICPVP